MPLKAVILDRDGTLYNPTTGQLQDGVPEMLERLAARGLNVFVASNEARDPAIERLIDLPTRQFLYSAQCGLKGSKRFVAAVLADAQCEVNELAYLGDSDNDRNEAATCRVALFNAEWSNPGYAYGLQASTPAHFADMVESYFLKDYPWYFSVEATDRLGKPISFRALLDPDTCKDTGITGLLKNRDVDFTRNLYLQEKAAHLVLHLLASIYLEGLHLRREPNKNNGYMKPLWSIYPGSDGGVSPILQLFERFTARLLTMQYTGDLLQRHSVVASSHKQRVSNGVRPNASTQVNSVQVNPKWLTRVKGNVVFVVDDFSTDSNAMETARHLLYACGAKQVVGISVGKYGRPPRYRACQFAAGVILPKKGGPVHPMVADRDIQWYELNGVAEARATDHF